MKICSLVLALACVMPGSLLAQQLQQPVVPTTKPVVPPTQSGVGEPLRPATATPAPIKLATDPAQRPQAPAAIPSTGPAREVPAGTLPASKAKPANVMDANGQPVSGMVQVAPNRVYDPATGRYHWTDGSTQQKLLKD